MTSFKAACVQMRSGRSVARNVDDAEALFRRCQAAGLRIIKGLKDKDYGLRAFVFEDPDGNRIDVGQIIERPAQTGS